MDNKIRMTEAELFDEWLDKAEDKGITFERYKTDRKKEIILVYKKICSECGEEFETEIYQKVFCHKCASIRRLQIQFKVNKKKAKGKSLVKVLKELEEYNNNHNAISYGEFVQMKGY